MKCREPDYAGQYSPWSCETIGSYIGSKDAKPKDVMVSGAMEMMVMNWWIFFPNRSVKWEIKQQPFLKFSLSCFFCQNVEAKELRETTLEAPRRGAEVKDDDPIIPFGPQPTVSRFGAISRTSKTGYQTTGPVQAMASTSQNQNSKHIPMTGKFSHKPWKMLLWLVGGNWI